MTNEKYKNREGDKSVSEKMKNTVKFWVSGRADLRSIPPFLIEYFDTQGKKCYLKISQNGDFYPYDLNMDRHGKYYYEYKDVDQFLEKLRMDFPGLDLLSLDKNFQEVSGREDLSLFNLVEGINSEMHGKTEKLLN